MTIPFCSFAGVTPLVLTLLASGPTTAQRLGTIEGTVYDASDGSPLAAAVVTVVGTGLQATSGADGTFRIDGVEAGEVVVRWQRGGYATLTDRVEVGIDRATELHIELEPLLVALGALRVEVAGGRGPGRAAQAGEGSAHAAGELLSGRVPGAQIIHPDGAVGRGGTILIRGVHSLTLSNQPLIYVDGVRVYAGAPGLANLPGWSANPSTLAFLENTDIERVEIVRGASAAAKYGPDANAGVILIYTRKGGMR